jgi:hypothetical protein
MEHFRSAYWENTTAIEGDRLPGIVYTLAMAENPKLIPMLHFTAL